MRGGSTYLKRERLGLGLESLLYPSRLGLGWGLYLWMRVVPWPCGKTKLTRAHARGGKLGLGLYCWMRTHARVDSQSPATGYWARCVLSARGRGYHEGATTFTHCRWAGEFRRLDPILDADA